jgi:hypothetical protein
MISNVEDCWPRLLSEVKMRRKKNKEVVRKRRFIGIMLGVKLAETLVLIRFSAELKQNNSVGPCGIP